MESAALLRRSIERVKASQMGLGYWDLRTHEIFWGLIAAQLRSARLRSPSAATES